jgi:hypothetical protein
MLGSMPPELVTETLAALPAGSDRLACTMARLSAFSSTLMPGEEAQFHSHDRAFSELGWPPLSFAVMWRDLMEVMHRDNAGSSPDQLRSATDALVEKARTAGDFEMLYAAYASGEASAMPWRHDPDRAIIEARDLVAAVVEGKGVIVGGLNVSHLAARLAIAMCKRGTTADIEEAHQLLIDLDRRYGQVAPLQSIALLTFSVARQPPLVQALVMGWLRKSHPMWSSLNKLLEADRIAATLSPQAFAQALEEGARLSNREAFALALGLETEAA